MASKKFIFRAQPALDKAVAEQKKCEEAVVAARRELEAQQQALQRLKDELVRIRQQIKIEHDNLVSPARTGVVSDPRELGRRGNAVEAEKLKEQRQLVKIKEQEERVAWAADKVDLRKRELNEAVAHVQALEKLKENRRKEHMAELAKAEEQKRDDDAIQLWNNQRDG